MKVDKDKVSAYGVHIFTATGCVFGFMCMLSIFAGDIRAAFLWLGISFFVDSIDGFLARKANVSENAPNISGEILDSIIDFWNYSLNPVLILWWFEYLPSSVSIYVCIIVLTTSLYCFVNTNMKVDEGEYFQGWPVCYNVVALYFYILNTHSWLNVIVLIALSILTFIPLKFPHPMRIKKLKFLTIFFTAIWSASSLYLVTEPTEIDTYIIKTVVLILWYAATAYFAYVSIIRSLRDYKIR